VEVSQARKDGITKSFCRLPLDLELIIETCERAIVVKGHDEVGTIPKKWVYQGKKTMLSNTKPSSII
jgi:hypothetical protein